MFVRLLRLAVTENNQPQRLSMPLCVSWRTPDAGLVSAIRSTVIMQATGGSAKINPILNFFSWRRSTEIAAPSILRINKHSRTDKRPTFSFRDSL